jgi:transcriptional regulator with XRE-family HTH domain
VSDRNDLAKFARKAYRDGYLQSRVRGMIAYQIQALREKLGMNQTDFAKKIGKTQSVVSRLEDTEYGRVSVQTLLDIACALDVALVVKFASYPDFRKQTDDASVRGLQPDTIQESLARAERPSVRYIEANSAASAFANTDDPSSQQYATPLQDSLMHLNDNSPPMGGAFYASAR